MNVAQFLTYIQYEKRYSPLTVQAYQIDLQQFVDFFANTYAYLASINEAQFRHIRAWMIHLLKQKRRAVTIRRKISCLKSYYTFLMREGLVASNPTEGLKMPKIVSKLPSFLTVQEMEWLLNDIPFNSDFSGTRDRLILELFYATGIRRSELIQLKWKDIDTGNQQISVLGKGKKIRSLPISTLLLQKIQTYQELANQQFPAKTHSYILMTDKGKPLYPKFVYHLVKKYLSLVSTQQQKGPHVLRHTFATNLLNNGADLNAVKKLLGHASLAATQVYTHNSIEKIKQAYQQAHPRLTKT